HNHACPTPGRFPVDGVVPVGRHISQIVHGETHNPAFLRFSKERNSEYIKILRKDGDDVDFHWASPSGSERSSNNPAGGVTVITRVSVSTSGTIASTKGTST